MEEEDLGQHRPASPLLRSPLEKKGSRLTPIAAVQGSGNQNKKAAPANYLSKPKKLEIEHWNDAANNKFTFNDLVCQQKNSLKGGAAGR